MLKKINKRVFILLPIIVILIVLIVLFKDNQNISRDYTNDNTNEVQENSNAIKGVKDDTNQPADTRGVKG